MKASRTLLLAVFLLCSALYTRAQPLFLISDHHAEFPATFSLDVQAATIDNLAGVQFSVRWDAGLLNLVEVNNLGLDINLNDNFGFQDIGNGRLNFFWLDGFTNGVAIPDTTVLFSLIFQVAGQPGFLTDVFFSDLPDSPIEVIDGALQLIEADFQEGTVQIGEVTAVGGPRRNEQDGFLAPNPLHAQAIWQLPVAGDQGGWLQAYDASGKPVFAREIQWQSNNPQISVRAAQFPGPGLYFLEVRLPSGRRFAQSVRVQ
jgi:hypothetical protein